MKFMDKLARMMYGRNGSDNLNQFILIISCVLAIFNIFFHNLIILITIFIMLSITTWRMMSKKIEARRRENACYLRIMRKFTGFFKLQKNKFKDRKTHVFKKCPRCKSVLRLPKKKGTHTVSCPKCHNRFDVKI